MKKTILKCVVPAILLASPLGVSGLASAQGSVVEEVVEEVVEDIAEEVDAGEVLGAIEAAAPAGSIPAEVEANPENWREVNPEYLIIFETTKGRVLIEAFPEIAPKHVEQYLAITRSGDYDGTAFHRVIDGFMAQGGDVFAKHVRETGLPDIPAEFTFRRDPAEIDLSIIGDPDIGQDGYYKGLPIRTQSVWLAELSADGRVESHIPHCRGVVSAARLGNNINSANSQFFLMRDRYDSLNKQYSPWGRIVDGQNAPQTMKTGDPQVVNPDILNKAHVAADLPVGERPRVWVERTDTPAFKAKLTELGSANVCDLPAVASVVTG